MMSVSKIAVLLIFLLGCSKAIVPSTPTDQIETWYKMTYSLRSRATSSWHIAALRDEKSVGNGYGCVVVLTKQDVDEIRSILETTNLGSVSNENSEVLFRIHSSNGRYMEYQNGGGGIDFDGSPIPSDHATSVALADLGYSWINRGNCHIPRPF